MSFDNVQGNWDEFFVASVLAASKESLYQSLITLNACHYEQSDLVLSCPL